MNLTTFHLYLFWAGLLTAVLPPVFAQSEGDASISSTCLFSCPESDTSSWPLVKRPHTIGWDSYYSIFECVYAVPKTNPSQQVTEHKCSYDKRSGLQRLAAAGDNCPPQAINCPQARPHDLEDDEGPVGPPPTPKFSNQDKDEIPSWVENGRSLLYLSEHQPS